MKAYYHVYSKSIAGKRNANDDNFLVITPGEQGGTAEWLHNDKVTRTFLPDWPENFYRLAVADGVGGLGNGKEASHAAIHGLFSSVPATTAAEMKALVEQVHQQLHTKLYCEKGKTPGTTLLLADYCSAANRLLLANVGDSRAYLVHKDQVERLTFDHTDFEFDYRAGELSKIEFEERFSQPANRIAQAVGNGSRGLFYNNKGFRSFQHDNRIRLDLAEDLPAYLKNHADVKEFILPDDHVLMLATDGLWNGNARAEWPGPLTKTFLSARELCLQVDQAVENGSRDNITVILFGRQNKKQIPEG